MLQNFDKISRVISDIFRKGIKKKSDIHEDPNLHYQQNVKRLTYKRSYFIVVFYHANENDDILEKLI